MFRRGDCEGNLCRISQSTLPWEYIAKCTNMHTSISYSTIETRHHTSHASTMSYHSPFISWATTPHAHPLPHHSANNLVFKTGGLVMVFAYSKFVPILNRFWVPFYVCMNLKIITIYISSPSVVDDDSSFCNLSSWNSHAAAKDLGQVNLTELVKIPIYRDQ